MKRGQRWRRPKGLVYWRDCTRCWGTAVHLSRMGFVKSIVESRIIIIITIIIIIIIIIISIIIIIIFYYYYLEEGSSPEQDGGQ